MLWRRPAQLSTVYPTVNLLCNMSPVFWHGQKGNRKGRARIFFFSWQRNCNNNSKVERIALNVEIPNLFPSHYLSLSSLSQEKNILGQNVNSFRVSTCKIAPYTGFNLVTWPSAHSHLLLFLTIRATSSSSDYNSVILLLPSTTTMMITMVWRHGRVIKIFLVYLTPAHSFPKKFLFFSWRPPISHLKPTWLPDWSAQQGKDE